MIDTVGIDTVGIDTVGIDTVGIDTAVLDWVVDERVPWLTNVFTFITTIGGVGGMALVSVVLTIVLLVRRHRSDALLVGGAMLSGWALMNATKLVIGRERPPLPQRLVEISSSSMPSGHAMLSMVLVCVVGAVIFHLRSPRYPIVICALLGAATLLDGLSRVYLAAHWLSDVLVGWAYGAAFAAVWIYSLRRRAQR